jgi:signal transduction histidine kinase/ActR/RegA family two-component response regulator
MSMSLDPEAIWAERFAEIGNVIESDCELLIGRWAERARAEQPGAVSAHFIEMRNMLPALLRAIGRGLAQSGEQAAVRHCLVAMEHGEQRWRVGWRLAEVVRDYQILRLVIFDHLDRTLNHWPLTVRETLAVGLALDEAISASVVAYVAHQESELRESSDRLNEFLAILGHELRNPLSAIVTTLQLMRLQEAAPSQVQAFEVLDRQVAQLTRLLDDMLDVSRLARGKLQLSKAPITAQEVIRRSIETTRSLFAARGHELEVFTPEPPIELFADAGRLEQVLTNLLTNAAKYTPPDGQIRVELAAEDGEAMICVRDNGLGIAPDMLPRITEMFTQAPQHRGQGLGIGLALAKTLLEMHGGTIEAHSDGPGKGSEFVCRLPLGPPTQRPMAAPVLPIAPPSAPRQRLVILVIDDQVDGLYELCLLLKLFGHEVHVAHSGAEGIEQAGRVRPQVVLLDLAMPGMDGYETARRLRALEETKQALLVAMTGYPHDDVRERARQAGFDDYLRKPVSFETVQDLLAQRQSAAEQTWN